MSQREDVLHIFEKSGAHSAWGINHCTRVYILSKELSHHLSLDDEILYIASMLHDSGRYPAYARPNMDHPLRSKGLASQILQRMAVASHKIPVILEAIEAHMYYSDPGRSDEAVYLRDADILDNLGNIGLMRLFSLIGQDDFIQTPEAALERARTFAEALPNKVYTKAGRRLAVKRREEMLRFLSGIKRQSSEYAAVL